MAEDLGKKKKDTLSSRLATKIILIAGHHTTSLLRETNIVTGNGKSIYSEKPSQ